MNSNQLDESGSVNKVWMSHAVTLEKSGTPVLCSIIFALLSIPSGHLRILETIWTNHFSIKFPGWLTYSTFVFVLSLSIGLLLQRMNRTSWRGLRKNARHLKKLEKKNIIDERTRIEAFRWLLANWLLYRMGGDPQQPRKAEEVMSSPYFQKLFDKLLP